MFFSVFQKVRHGAFLTGDAKYRCKNSKVGRLYLEILDASIDNKTIKLSSKESHWTRFFEKLDFKIHTNIFDETIKIPKIDTEKAHEVCKKFILFLSNFTF